MANGFPVIATGPTPPGRSATFGTALGGGLGQGFGGVLGQQAGLGFARRRLSRQLDPFTAAAAQAPELGLTPEQAMVQAALSNPDMLAQLTTNPAVQQAVSSAGVLGQPPPVATSDVTVVSGDSELGRQLGIQSGQQARVQFDRDVNGNLIGDPKVVANPQDIDETANDPFGADNRGRSMENVVNLAPAFAEGSATPEQDRIFLASISNLTQEEEFEDPDTNLIVTRRPELPQFAREALRARGIEVRDGELVMPSVADPATQPQPSDTTAFQAAQQAQPTASQDEVIASRAPEMPTVFEMTDDITGPRPILMRGLARLGIPAQAEVSALAFTRTMKEKLVKALQQNPRYAEGEAERIGQGIDLDPKIIDSPTRMQDALIGFDDALEIIERESFEVLTGKRAMVPGETRQHAMSTLNAITNARQWLLPPRVRSLNEAEQFRQNNPPGTPILWFDDEKDRWVLIHTTGGEQ